MLSGRRLPSKSLLLLLNSRHSPKHLGHERRTTVLVRNLSSGSRMRADWRVENWTLGDQIGGWTNGPRVRQWDLAVSSDGREGNTCKMSTKTSAGEVPSARRVECRTGGLERVSLGMGRWWEVSFLLGGTDGHPRIGSGHVRLLEHVVLLYSW